MTKWPAGEISNYGNAMEPLVIEELEVQLQKLPVEAVEKINKNEAIAYALNRLPALYSTTEEGWYWQQERAREKLADLIAKVVGWAIRKTQKPKGNFIKPLPNPNTASEAALERLKKLLVCEELSWENLPDVVEETLMENAEEKISLNGYKSRRFGVQLPKVIKNYLYPWMPVS